MLNRRLLLALPALLAMPVRAAPPTTLAAALVTCWQARGVRFTHDQMAARIGARTGRDALLALAGAAENANGDGEEIAVETVWDADAPTNPALLALLHRDLARGLPGVLLARDGQWWLLRALDEAVAGVADPIGQQYHILAIAAVALIGRPVIAGA